MTIASTTSRITYVGNGSTTAFAVPFYFSANADLVVMLQNSLGVASTLVLGTDYNLTGAGVSSGGTCTFTIAPTATTGAVITIYRDPAVTQTTSYNNNDPFPAKSHEAALDKLTTLEQRTRNIIVRSLQLPDSDPIIDMHMPTVVNRKSKLLGFDSSGAPTAVLGPTFVNSTYTSAAVVDTRATAAVTTFAGTVNFIITGGLTLPGDGGDAIYIRGTGTGSFTDGGAVSWKPISSGAALVETRAAAALKTFSPSINYVVTGGLVTAGDALGDVYIRGSGDGGFTDAGSTAWKPVNASPNAIAAQAASIGQTPAAVPSTATVTVTIATPGVFTWTAHGLGANSPITLTTTGALPTGLTASTVYYIIGSSITTNTFKVATSVANAQAGTAVNTSGSQSGTHTAVANALLPGMKGYIYEGERVIGSPIAVLNQTVTEVCTTGVLPAGTYDLTGEAIMTSGATVWSTEYHIVVTTTAAPTLTGLPNKGGGNGDHQIWATAQGSVFPVGPMRLVLTAPATARLNVYSTFGTNGTNGGGNLNSFGYIRAEVK